MNMYCDCGCINHMIARHLMVIKPVHWIVVFNKHKVVMATLYLTKLQDNNSTLC